MKVQMQGECDDADDSRHVDADDRAHAVWVGGWVLLVTSWWCVVVVILGLGGCTLLRWGDNPGHMDNVTPIVTVLKLDVPRVNITFGWSDGTFLLRNGGIVAGVLGAGVMLMVVLSLMPLIRRRINDRKE